MEALLGIALAVAQLGFLIAVIRSYLGLRDPEDTPPAECENPKFCNGCFRYLNRESGREYLDMGGSIRSFCLACAERERHGWRRIAAFALVGRSPPEWGSPK